MGKLKKVLLTIGTVIAMVAGTLVPVPAAAAPSTSFQLIAFGVKVDSTATTVTDIGWGRGNSQKGWTEGNWWPGKLVITNVQTNYPGLSGLPDIYVSFDFTANTGARFVDLVRDIQVGTTDLTDNQGWPGYDTGNSSNLPTLAQVRAAQNSVGEAAFPGYTMGESTPGWSATAQVNLPLNGNTPSSLGTAPGTTTDGKHQFVFYADQIKSAVSSSADTIIIYFEMHLSRTFIWSNGLESGYSTPGSDTYPEGGWLYGLDGYTGATPDRRNGSGFAPGSSGHAALNMTGLGNITCQIPVPPQPTGTISGYKWQDDNSNGVKDGSEVFLANWGIHIFGVLDREVFELLLSPGERSGLFISRSRIQKRYGRQTVHFFYLRGDEEVARVEVPAWVAEDEARLGLVHSVVVDQCRRGQGYPVALSEAHEKAVVTGADRDVFWRMVEDAMVDEKLPATESAKSLSKLRRWV